MELRVCFVVIICQRAQLQRYYYESAKSLYIDELEQLKKRKKKKRKTGVDLGRQEQMENGKRILKVEDVEVIVPE